MRGVSSLGRVAPTWFGEKHRWKSSRTSKEWNRKISKPDSFHWKKGALIKKKVFLSVLIRYWKFLLKVGRWPQRRSCATTRNIIWNILSFFFPLAVRIHFRIFSILESKNYLLQIRILNCTYGSITPHKATSKSAIHLNKVFNTVIKKVIFFTVELSSKHELWHIEIFVW